MKTIEELNAEHAKALQALQTAHTIAQACPVVPKHVTSELSNCPWVAYDVKTLRDAVDVFRAFTVRNFAHYRGTFGHLKPESLMKPKDLENATMLSSGFVCGIRVSHTHGQYGPNAELWFFAMLQIEGKARPVRVMVRFGGNYIGACQALRPVTHETKGIRNTTAERRFTYNEDARALSDYQVSWGSYEYGPLKTHSEFDYLFCGDVYEDAIGTEHEHAIGQLVNLADILKI